MNTNEQRERAPPRQLVGIIANGERCAVCEEIIEQGRAALTTEAAPRITMHPPCFYLWQAEYARALLHAARRQGADAR